MKSCSTERESERRKTKNQEIVMKMHSKPSEQSGDPRNGRVSLKVIFPAHALIIGLLLSAMRGVLLQAATPVQFHNAAPTSAVFRGDRILVKPKAGRPSPALAN